MARATALNDPAPQAKGATEGAAGGSLPGAASATATALLCQSLAHSTVLLYEGAAAQYQRSQAAAQAAAVLGTLQLYSIGTMAGAVATGRIAQAGAGPPSLLQLVAAARALHKD